MDLLALRYSATLELCLHCIPLRGSVPLLARSLGLTLSVGECVLHNAAALRAWWDQEELEHTSVLSVIHVLRYLQKTYQLDENWRSVGATDPSPPEIGEVFLRRIGHRLELPHN